jgi:hypothetical protein
LAKEAAVAKMKGRELAGTFTGLCQEIRPSTDTRSELRCLGGAKGTRTPDPHTARSGHES